MIAVLSPDPDTSLDELLGLNCVHKIGAPWPGMAAADLVIALTRNTACGAAETARTSSVLRVPGFKYVFHKLLGNAEMMELVPVLSGIGMVKR